jgi:formylglycine-generating enzyme required for sulfatase activity
MIKKIALMTCMMVAWAVLAYAVNPDDYIYQDFEIFDQAVKKNSVIKGTEIYISPTPEDAQISFLSGKISYSRGMVLKPGRYHIAVSKPGYKDMTKWIDVKPGRKLNLSFVLKKVPAKKHRAGEIWIDTVTGMEFIWIPGGSFIMGTDDGRPDEAPAHKEELEGFWMGKYEVTNAQYRKYKPDHDSKKNDGGSLNADENPVVFVSWEDAVDFTKWLSAKGQGQFSLPSEIQWEYACRAGSSSEYFFGDDPDMLENYVWYAENSVAGFKLLGGHGVSHPVGKLKPNAFGLYDMLGNVWEWCIDGYDKFAYFKKRENHKSDRYRVLRGGSFLSSSEYLRCATRHWSATGERSRMEDYGFRVVRTD